MTIVVMNDDWESLIELSHSGLRSYKTQDFTVFQLKLFFNKREFQPPTGQNQHFIVDGLVEDGAMTEGFDAQARKTSHNEAGL